MVLLVLGAHVVIGFAGRRVEGVLPLPLGLRARLPALALHLGVRGGLVPAVLRAPLPGLVARLQPGLLAGTRSRTASVGPSVQRWLPNLLGRFALAGAGAHSELQAACVIRGLHPIMQGGGVRLAHKLLDGRLPDTLVPIIFNLLLRLHALDLLLRLARAVQHMMPLHQNFGAMLETMAATRQSFRLCGIAFTLLRIGSAHHNVRPAVL